MNTSTEVQPRYASTSQSLEGSEPRRRGRKKQISRELAVMLVRSRMLEGTFDDEGVETPRRTLAEFARVQQEEGVTRHRLHPVLLSRLFAGRIYPDLEVDGEKVNWEKMPPSKGRGPSTGRSERTPDGRTFREALEALELSHVRLQGSVETLRIEVSRLKKTLEELRPAPGGAS